MDEKRISLLIDLMLRFHHFGDAIPPFDELGITPAQFYYIDQLARKGPCSLKDVTEGMGLSPASVSVMLKHLEERGLISRKVNPTDKRSFDLDPTRAGRSIFSKVDRYRKQKAQMFLSRLNETEQGQFLMLFEKTMNEPKERG
jgi:DNA-binding MarR family transcriptional regulator